MANNHVQCEMCCKEEAVGYCNICGNICESCGEIHEKGRAFQNHILKMYGKDGYNSRSIIYDITEEICKHHPTERALLFCKIHELMICGRCFRSDHISCGQEVVDLCQEAGHVDNNQTNAMSAALNEIKDDSKRMKEEIDRQKERSNIHAVKCNKELDDLKNRLERKVEHSISTFKEEEQKLHDENIAAFSFISSVCEEKVSWAIKEESQLNEFVNNSLTGRLYLLSRNFDKEISEVKRQMKEAKYKHTFKHFCLKESMVAFKCLTEDLRDVCELQEEVDGSDEGTTFSIRNATQETQKTRTELIEALVQAKRDLEKAETTRKNLEYEGLQVRQRLHKSERKRQELCDELKQVKQELYDSKQTRYGLYNELKDVKQEKYNLEMIRTELSGQLKQVQQDHNSSEMIKTELNDKLEQVQQHLENSEKDLKWFQTEFLRAKQVIEKKEKELKRSKQESMQAKQGWGHYEDKRSTASKSFDYEQLQPKRDYYEYLNEQTRVDEELNCMDERSGLPREVWAKIREGCAIYNKLIWTQPVGAIEVRVSEIPCAMPIKLKFTFPEGIQMQGHPSPGKQYKSAKFTVHLNTDSESMLVCRMLKAAFRRGQMFVFGRDGEVGLDGISLRHDTCFTVSQMLLPYMSYEENIQQVKAELEAKGITEANIDMTEQLELGFTYIGL
ncbi:dynein regulatory complex subunit 4-like isoform X2 [Mya arenaria]|uniref:dynein regulatory complex subunit 4-like isoform X2 n=1 Tax=Mya arenaria TaxID=6604 RepID=UPI0022E82A56|nr:dynein regulatory complex subunit 4-like isoform X2 [Mya arenaria]